MDIIFYSLSFLILKGVFGDEVKSVSVMEGESVTLYTDIVKQKDDLIVWSYGPENTFIARINGKAGSILLSDDERFKGRVKLNDQTGDLIIPNIKTTDSGVYTRKISTNNKVSYKKFNVMVNGVFGDEVKSVSVMEGESVTLYTDVVRQRDDLIVWSYGAENTFIARINGKAGSIMLSEDERFRDRVMLDDKTGDLIITNIKTTDSGVYTRKISSNYKVSYKKFSVNVYGVIGDEVKSVSVVTVNACVRDEVESVSVMEGEAVPLYTDITELQEDDLMMWSYGPENTFVARINGIGNGNMLSEDERFKDRLQVNDQTGDLTITYITTQHIGDYLLEISRNNKVSYKKFNVMVNDSPVQRVVVISVISLMLCVSCIIIICVYIYTKRFLTALQANRILMDEEKHIKPSTAFKDPESSSFNSWLIKH